MPLLATRAMLRDPTLSNSSPSCGERAMGHRSAGTTWARSTDRSTTKVVSAGPRSWKGSTSPRAAPAFQAIHRAEGSTSSASQFAPRDASGTSWR
eukprot:4807193-Lingulodinium_polyedra.AAC.1